MRMQNKNILAMSFKVKHTLIKWTNISTSEYLLQEKWKHYVHTDLCVSVHSIIIYDSQNWEQLKSPSMDELLNTMLYPYCGILLSNTEEQTIGIYNLVDRKMLPPPKKRLIISSRSFLTHLTPVGLSLGRRHWWGRGEGHTWAFWDIAVFSFGWLIPKVYINICKP